MSLKNPENGKYVSLEGLGKATRNIALGMVGVGVVGITAGMSLVRPLIDTPATREMVNSSLEVGFQVLKMLVVVGGVNAVQNVVQALTEFGR